MRKHCKTILLLLSFSNIVVTTLMMELCICLYCKDL